MNALRGVDLGIATGELTAVMGPSGSGKSTLMHILAGLDRPTEGSVTIGGQDITQLSDNDLTLLRREHIGFIFQFFNLLPMLTAAENVVLPLSLAGRQAGPPSGCGSSPTRSASATASVTARPSSPAASSSASRSPARSSRGRRSCSPTSRPATSTRAPAARSSTLLRSMVSDLGQTTVMVTHDAHAAAIADRVLFLADGEIVRDLGPSDAHTILDTLEAGHGAMIKVALKGLAGRKVRALLTALAVVIGVSMVSGTFVLTDTMQKAFDGIFEESYEGTDAVVNGKQLVEFSSGGRATVPAVAAREGQGAARPSTRPRAACRTCRATPTPPSCSTATARSSAAQGETMGVGIDDAGRQFSPLKLKQGDWAHGDDEIVARRRHGEQAGLRGRRHDPGRRHRPGQAVQDHGHRHLRLGRLARRRLARRSSTSRRRRRCSTRKAQYDSISVKAADGVTPDALTKEIKPLLPKTADVKTGDAQAAADSKDVNESLKFITYFLLGFGGIALFVGAFVILNTLSITVAQRSREFATLRTLGASRRQVMRSVVLEGLVVGLLASVLGLAGSGSASPRA